MSAKSAASVVTGCSTAVLSCTWSPSGRTSSPRQFRLDHRADQRKIPRVESGQKRPANVMSWAGVSAAVLNFVVGGCSLESLGQPGRSQVPEVHSDAPVRGAVRIAVGQRQPRPQCLPRLHSPPCSASCFKVNNCLRIITRSPQAITHRRTRRRSARSSSTFRRTRSRLEPSARGITT